MRDSFTYEAYRALVGGLSRTHALCRFVDVRDGMPARGVILRHDVDYSPGAALRMAMLEARAGWRATYFLLPNGPYYNLLAPEHAGFPRQLVELGHEVGLHYDARFFAGFLPPERDAILDAQAELLATLSGARVASIAMHQPGLNGADPFAQRTDLLNAYHPRFVREATYVSDSCRAWRDASWRILSEGPVPDRLQLGLHPVNWAEGQRSRAEVFAAVRGDALQAIERSHDDLLRKVAAHAAVREHDACTRSRTIDA